VPGECGVRESRRSRAGDYDGENELGQGGVAVRDKALFETRFDRFINMDP